MKGDRSERVRAVRPGTARGMAAVAFAVACVLACLTPRAAGQSAASPAATPAVTAVGAIVLPVSDLDRAVEFFFGVLAFERVSETEVTGDSYERLEGVFGLRMRVARMKLGDEELELAQYLAPEGRPLPADSRSNDRWFQHI